MEGCQLPVVSQRMRILKKNLKSFERQFLTDNGRKPSIEDTSEEVKGWSKEYHCLKRLVDSELNSESSSATSDHSTDSSTLSSCHVKDSKSPCVTEQPNTHLNGKSANKDSVFSKELNKEHKKGASCLQVIPTMTRLRSWKKPLRMGQARGLSSPATDLPHNVADENSLHGKEPDTKTVDKQDCPIVVALPPEVQQDSTSFFDSLNNIDATLLVKASEQSVNKDNLSLVKKDSLHHRLSSTGQPDCTSPVQSSEGDHCSEINSRNECKGVEEDQSRDCSDSASHTAVDNFAEEKCTNGELDVASAKEGNCTHNTESSLHGVDRSFSANMKSNVLVDRDPNQSFQANLEISPSQCSSLEGTLGVGKEECVFGGSDSLKTVEDGFVGVQITISGSDATGNSGVISVIKDCNGAVVSPLDRLHGGDKSTNFSDVDDSDCNFEIDDLVSVQVRSHRKCRVSDEKRSSAIAGVLASPAATAKEELQCPKNQQANATETRAAFDNCSENYENADDDLATLYTVDSTQYPTIESRESGVLGIPRERPNEETQRVAPMDREVPMHPLANSHCAMESMATEAEEPPCDEEEPPAKRARRKAVKESTDVSQNFVRLNMKIKHYKRKGQSNTSKFKKYKHGKGRNVCYKCGVKGHWARFCPTSQNLGSFDGVEVQYCSADDDSGKDSASNDERLESNAGPEPTAMSAPTKALGTDVQSATSEQQVEKSTGELPPGADVVEPPSLQKSPSQAGNVYSFEEADDGQETKLSRPAKQRSRSNKRRKVEENELVSEQGSASPSLPCGHKPKNTTTKKQPRGSKASSSTYKYSKPRPAKGATSRSRVNGTQTSDERHLLQRPPMNVKLSSSVISTVPPLYGGNEDLTGILLDALPAFGFSDFRPGQKKVIERILKGQSTLFVQSTGSGKSLCYQVPARLYWERYKAVTVVISPLVSLMEDQVNNLPRCLHGACLHSGMDPRDRQAVLDQIRSGSIAVLLVSPEAVVGERGGGFWNALSAVSFVCIDEVHCVSQWSHNFRPAYLRVCKIFRERCGISCFLGITATATKSTVDSVAEFLKLPEEGVVQGQILPPNLVLQVSSSNNKDSALLQLLQSEPFRSCDSIIIYCTRQQTTERVAQTIRTCMQSLDSVSCLRSRDGKPGGAKRQITEVADCYHAGMSSYMRSRIQKKFMTGRLRIVAATVAFGMGLNKPDVRAIIHYNMPRSFESYVQEIGRAGRDGKPAFCHVFLDNKDEDTNELRKHIHANSVDRFAVKQLITRLSIPPVPACAGCKAPSSGTGHLFLKEEGSSVQRDKAGHFLAMSISECVNACDLKEETLVTYLCYLELEGWLDFFKTANDTCVLKFYEGQSHLDLVAEKVDIVSAARDSSVDKGNVGPQVELSFSISDVCNRLPHHTWEDAQKRLFTLQFEDPSNVGGKSGVLAEFAHPSYIVRVSCGYTPEDRDVMCDHLYNRVQQQETSDLAKLTLLHQTLRTSAMQTDADSSASSEAIVLAINAYFSDQLDAPQLQTTRELLDSLSEKQNVRVCRDIRVFLGTHEDHTFTARSVARIFHGIQSPNFPADVWGRDRRFWRAHIQVDFHVLIRLAQEQIVAFLTVV